MRKIGAINPRDQTVLLQPLLCEKETNPAKPLSARLSRLTLTLATCRKTDSRSRFRLVDEVR